jgi:hypothetical protein
LYVNNLENSLYYENSQSARKKNKIKINSHLHKHQKPAKLKAINFYYALMINPFFINLDRFAYCSASNGAAAAEKNCRGGN